jgi:hypothetical protein
VKPWHGFAVAAALLMIIALVSMALGTHLFFSHGTG